MKVDEKKLEELHHYFTKEKGSTELVDVMKKIGTADEKVKDLYVAALRAKWPKVYGQEETEEVESAKEPQPEKKAEPLKEEKAEPKYTVVLTNEQGFGEELEIVGIKGDKIYTKRKVPTDIVTVKIGGQDVEVDILELRRADKTEQRHGVSVATLLVMAQVAKG